MIEDRHKGLILYSLISLALDTSGLDNDPHAETLKMLCGEWNLSIDDAAKLIVAYQEWRGGFATLDRMTELLKFYIGTD